ncbi:NAD(P)/FAD-dependent oxidoreductase [Panacibacter ginsenosidivorans]|uniref:NAD(P)/FAD-dependent oxidoreductase n=1 Tax=Panacibacter ginsenosidivorans TaxID=1813871 RepID=A0A5B8VDQ1_9BACT|nr:NAD(P)/FAD-dependent oxidoreductase [Panacibacter ginsenosidivorans]QEC69442.1 NAD(P)/FAD-dependent oxidoreductase [Panacibacter ginsenosidivorans]
MQKKLIVIGGGAAGFFCAVNAARLNPLLKVVIVEKSSKVLSKVKVSGGGRCNVTHACFEIPELIKHYPRGQNFLKKSFHWFSTKDTIAWFEERGVKLKTEADGRMFPVTNDSQTIIDCLIKEANKYGVEILFNTGIKKITRIDDHFQLDTEKQKLETDFLCIASGGYTKATQFEWLQQIGHSIETPVPSLFTFNIPDNSITSLMGVSVDHATIKIQSTKLSETGPLLITHWGLSGPVVLKLSAWGARELAHLQYNFSISVNWLPAYNENSLRTEWQHLRDQHAAQKISNKNPFGLPGRLWLYMLDVCSINIDTRWADLSATLQNKLIKTITGQVFQVKGKTTFKEEFVTCGGIKLTEIDANTMQSKIVPNLFFAGEVMDIDGITGGFNFQNAWTSGWIAANHIATLE